MTLADILAALQGQPTGAAQPVRTTPEGGLDLRAILAGAQLDQQRSPYERTMRPGETRSAGDVQNMLAEVILAAGSGALPGVGPRGQARQAPGMRTVRYTSDTGAGYTRKGEIPLFGRGEYHFAAEGAPPPIVPGVNRVTRGDIDTSRMLDLRGQIPAEQANRLIEITKQLIPGAFGKSRTLYGKARVKNREPVSGEDLYWSLRGQTGRAVTGEDIQKIARAAGFDGVVFKGNKFGNIPLDNQPLEHTALIRFPPTGSDK